MSEKSRTVVIRPARVEDITFIKLLMANIINESHLYPKSAKAGQIEHLYGNCINNSVESNLCVVAECDDEICGTCFGENDDGLIWLSWVAVKPDFRTMGVAQKMMKEFITDASAKGHKLWCSVIAENTNSNLLMESMQFEKVAVLKKHWCKLDFFLWEKIF